MDSDLESDFFGALTYILVTIMIASIILFLLAGLATLFLLPFGGVSALFPFVACTSVSVFGAALVIGNILTLFSKVRLGSTGAAIHEFITCIQDQTNIQDQTKPEPVVVNMP